VCVCVCVCVFVCKLLKEIKSLLKSGNACHHTEQDPVSSNLLSKNMKNKIYGTVLLFVLYVCETWSLTLRDEHRLRVFENGVLRKISEPTGKG